MTIRHVRPSEARFVGNGNVWADGGLFRAWQVTCSACPATKTISSHNGSSIPPHLIIKKLRQAGWRAGARPKDDLCPECQRKPAMSHIGQAKKALSHLVAPMVSNGVSFSEVEALALKLPPEQAKQLMKTLREALPAPPPAAPKPKKVQEPVEQSEAEYAKWLDELG